MNKISSKHFIFFIIGVSFISIKTYPSIFINLGGRDSWISSLIACIIFIGYVFYIIHICKITNNYSLNSIFNSLPKVASTVLLGLFVLTLFLSAIESGAVEGNVLHSTLFLNTPVWYALIFFLLPSFFLLNKDIRTILIFVLVSVFTLCVNSVIIFLLTQKYKEINYILPVLGYGIDTNFITCTILILGSLSSFSIILPFMKFLKMNHNIKIHSFYAAIITSAIVIFSIISVITYFGPIRSSNIFYPEFVMCQRVELAGFLEFGELFFIIQTVIGYFTKYILASYSILLICNKLIKNKKLFIGIYTFLTFILSIFLGRNNYFLYEALKYFQVIYIIGFFIIPLVTFSLFYLKSNLKENSRNLKKN